ncbi:hypothetical protein Q1695_005380 [Nippostrongylus brasiliensis]|nr:hypothetical protein Q1695_005380 [Nippostrongylus brasiliensis]
MSALSGSTGPENHPIKRALEFEAPGKRDRGALKERWRDVNRSDFKKVRATSEDVQYRTGRATMIKRR